MNTSIYKGEIIMTLKRITACVLCLILAMALTAPAVAEDGTATIEYNPNNAMENSYSSTVSYAEESYFKLKVPTSIPLSKVDGDKITGSAKMSITASQPVGTGLRISISSNNYDNSIGKWYLTGTSGQLYYNISKDGGNTYLANYAEVLEYYGKGYSSSADTILTFLANTADNQQLALGSYTGLITFTIANK